MSTNNEFELMKENFMNMGYDERTAALMAQGRGQGEFLTEANETSTNPDPVVPPIASSPTAPEDVKVSGTYQAKDSPNVNRSFDEMLKYLNFEKPTFNKWVRVHKAYSSRKEAVEAISTALDAMGFTAASATKAATTIFGSSGELPAQAARDAAADPTTSTSDKKESMRQAYLGMGYSLKEAEIMAQGRD
jgi:hypothetical protein